MDQYPREELNKAIGILDSVLTRCLNIQPKFSVGTSQHTLLQNRIHALSISKALMTQGTDRVEYSKEILIESLNPIISIIAKCEKAQRKFDVGSSHHQRFKEMIDAMNISKEFILNEIDRT